MKPGPPFTRSQLRLLRRIADCNATGLWWAFPYWQYKRTPAGSPLEIELLEVYPLQRLGCLEHPQTPPSPTKPWRGITNVEARIYRLTPIGYQLLEEKHGIGYSRRLK